MVIIQKSYLFLGDSSRQKYFEMNTWDEKAEFLLSKVGQVLSHRVEYLKEANKDIISRLGNILSYEMSDAIRLRSNVTLIKPEEKVFAELKSEDYQLSDVCITILSTKKSTRYLSASRFAN